MTYGNVPSILKVYHTNHCYETADHLAWLLEFTTAWMIIGGLASFFHLNTNPNACKKSWWHWVTPVALSISAYYMAIWIQDLRPYPICLAWYHTIYGLPIPELVWFESTLWVDLQHGVFFHEEVGTWASHIRLLGYIVAMAFTPIMVQMSGLGTPKQIVLSFLFSTLAIPMYISIEWCSQRWREYFHSEKKLV